MPFISLIRVHKIFQNDRHAMCINSRSNKYTEAISYKIHLINFYINDMFWQDLL